MIIQVGAEHPVGLGKYFCAYKKEQHALSYESKKNVSRGWVLHVLSRATIKIHWPHSPAKVRGDLVWILGHHLAGSLCHECCNRGEKVVNAGDPNLAMHIQRMCVICLIQTVSFGRSWHDERRQEVPLQFFFPARIDIIHDNYSYWWNIPNQYAFPNFSAGFTTYHYILWPFGNLLQA